MYGKVDIGFDMSRRYLNLPVSEKSIRQNLKAVGKETRRAGAILEMNCYS